MESSYSVRDLAPCRVCLWDVLKAPGKHSLGMGGAPEAQVSVPGSSLEIVVKTKGDSSEEEDQETDQWEI